MRFIQQLTRIVNPQLSHILLSVPSDNMLEQFYAVYIVRLCDKGLLARLSIVPDTANLFEKVWSDSYHRNIICHELSLSHHLEEETTQQLISASSPLVYQQIKQQAYAENLPVFDFLQQHINQAKNFLPIWVELVIPKAILSGEPQQYEQPTPTTAVNDNVVDALDGQNMKNLNIDDEELPPYINPSRRKKKSRLKKKQRPRKKSTKARDKNKVKKILIIVIALMLLTSILVGAWFWYKHYQAENTTVILTPEQPTEENAPVPEEDIEEQEQTDNQDIAVFSAIPHNQNIAVPHVQPPQASKQKKTVPPAQPPQANNQNFDVPPAQPPQPMNAPPPIPQPQEPIIAYDEPPMVNNPPPQQPMQPPNGSGMIFEFNNNNDSGGISEAKFNELTDEEIIAENAENQP